MRTAFFALLLVNLLFLAWAEWVDVPVRHADPIAHLPNLQLVGESVPGAAPSAAAQSKGASRTTSQSDAPAAAQPIGTASPATAQPAGAPAESAQSGVESSASIGSARTSVGAPLRRKAAVAHASDLRRCVSIGPFNREADLRKAVKLLRERRLMPRERTESPRADHEYRVYLSGMHSDAEVRRTLERLGSNGIKGARPMRARGGDRDILLAVFKDRQLALSEARLAHARGFKALIAERPAARQIYWLDLWLRGGKEALARMTPKLASVGTGPCPSGDAPPQLSDAIE